MREMSYKKGANGSRFVLFVDGLDEITNKENRDGLIDNLKNIQEIEGPQRLRVLVTSRTETNASIIAKIAQYPCYELLPLLKN